MERLLQQQSDKAVELEHIISNYKKDGAARKTKRYLEAKIATLKKTYNEYVDVDNKIREFQPEIESTHQYNKDRQVVRERFTKYVEDMRQRLNASSLPSTPAPDASAKFDFADEESSYNNQKLLKKQDVLMRMMHRKLEAIEEALDNNNIPMEFIRLKMAQLSQEMGAIDDLHINLLVEMEEQEQTAPYFQNNYYEALKERVDSTTLRWQRSRKEDTSNQAGEVKVQLPKIELPTFYGDYEHWSSFNDIFTELIHNNNKLADTIKMTYLKANLQKGAAQLISHLSTTGDNYNKAWEILQRRYNNPRLLANKYFNSLLTLPTIHAPSAAAIRNLHDTTVELLHNINKLKLHSPFEALVMFILGKKLDPETARLYETSLENPRETKRINEFFSFIERRFQSLEAMGFNKVVSAHPQPMVPLKRVHATTVDSQCIVKGCQGKHLLQDCNQFKLMPTLERSKLVCETATCIRCLTRHSMGNPCRSAIRCIVCQGHHHTLLHGNNKVSTNMGITQTLVVKQQGPVLLPTAMVRVATDTGHLTTLRALIDSGSQATLISSRAANLLNIKKRKTNVNISGIGGSEAGMCKHTINIKLVPRFDGDFSLDIEALIFNKLTQQLPEADIDTRAWTHLNNIKLADPHYNQAQPIDLIIGADYYPLIITNSIIKGDHREPMAQNTEFGWVVIGSLSNINTKTRTTMVTTKSIEEQLKLFIEVDSIPEERSHTAEEKQVEEAFQSTLSRDTDGRFIVKIPFKDDHVKLGESRKRAVARLLQIERRFVKDPGYEQLYKQFMQEYIDLSHMELIQEKPEVERGDNTYYIPHHGIIKPGSSTTKLRVVFDASSKTTTGVSLNDIMMTGPKIQEDLADILLRWRKHKIVMTADIEKMFRQIWLNTSDRDYHRVLWRQDSSEPIKAYRLKTITYGTTAASFLAVRTLIQVAKEGCNTHPKAAKIMMTDFYMDDLLTGADSIDEALLLVQDLQALTAQGGFNLRKWASNSPKILQSLPREQQANGNIQIKLNDTIKTLGILYNPAEDIFEFDIAGLQLTNNQHTKRSFLSDSSKLFDPIGWLSPTTIMAKIMMQDVWKIGISWDEQLPERISAKWQNYKDDLNEISRLKIPRWLSTTSRCKTELHGFADASEHAYAAVVYCRTVDDNGKPAAQLLMSKTRVAPSKTKLSIPRLELNAALLLAKLLKHVQDTMKLENVNTYAWSDSTITLCWIKGDPSRFKTFVANRISTIKKTLPTTTWHHVKSHENPADAASRGITPKQLIDNNLWWHGPSFLTTMPPQWNTEELVPDPPSDLQAELEEKRVLATVIKGSHILAELFNRLSTFSKIKRTVAYCLRFINNCQQESRNKGWLTGNELKAAETAIIKITQDQDFGPEIACMNKDRRLEKDSKLGSLNPFLDGEGLLRVMGRLQNSNLTTASKQPAILSKNNIITQRIIEEAHQNTLHGGAQLTLAMLRQKYWIIDGRRAVKQVIQKCITCFRYKQKHMEQLMGSLPSARVSPGRPFSKTGIDYAGPIQLRTTKGRGNKSYKGYIALFVCMTTKAIHIEIVSSLTTEAFIAAYKRFVSRRGLCTDIFSDNGTYFVGANSVMKKTYSSAMTTLPDDVAAMLASDETTWHFIPPHTPHFGGIWEAGIKSVKFHLKRVIGDSTLTFEELTTLTTQIEAVLNSRPLIALTNDTTDTTALTPGHFLIGDALKAMPEATTSSIGLRTRWHMVEKMAQDFWKRWSSEYIHQLQQRSKWKTSQPNLAINDLVLVKDDQLPPTRWKLGRITDTHAGKDDLVRIVTVKCKDATYKRPITKLCKLPINDDSSEMLPMKAIATLKETTTEKASAITTQNNKLVSRQQPHRRTKATGKMNHMALAILSVCCLFGLVSSNIEISPFNHSIGIHFEELGKLEIVATKWTLVVQYNLSSYWEEIENFKRAHTELQSVCRELSGLKCDIILQQLLFQYNYLIADNELLFESNKDRKRMKRGLGDSVGLVLGDLFGVLTQREADKYESYFEQINSDENYLLTLIKNQTTIVDNTINLVKHNTNLTTASINNLIKDQHRLRQEMLQLNEYRTYEDRVRSTLMAIFEMMLVLKSIQDTQQGLLNVIYHAHQDVLHPSILTPSQLEEELQFIRQHVPVTITLPGHDIHDLHHVYESMQIRSRVTEKNVIIEITLPLSFVWDYTLIAVVPIPNIIHGSTQSQIISSTDYIAMDNRREHFALLTREDVHKCQVFNPVHLLCEVSQIINTPSNQTSCEVAILQRKNELDTVCGTRSTKASNHWIKLHAANQWIYVIPNEITIDVICGSRIQSYTIVGSGIVEIESGCVLRDSDVQLIAVGTARHNINKFAQQATHLMHRANNLREFSAVVKNKANEVDQLNLLTTPETTGLDDQLESLKNDEQITFYRQSAHHIHHYAMIHILFWSAVVIGVIWVANKLRGRCIANHRPPSPLERANESMV